MKIARIFVLLFPPIFLMSQERDNTRRSSKNVVSTVLASPVAGAVCV